LGRVDDRKPIGLWEWQRPNEYRVDDAEHRRRRADAERQHANRSQGEST
jgi:hypothetical protein